MNLFTKRIFMGIVSVLMTISMSARQIDFKTFSFTFPDTYVRVQSDELMLYCLEKNTDMAFSVAHGSSGTFGSHDSINKYGKLSAYKSRRSFFLRLNNKCSRRYYKADDIILVHYTFTAFGYSYSFLFKCPNEQGVKEAEAIINSVRLKGTWLNRVSFVLKNGSLILLLFYIAFSFLAANMYVKGEQKTTSVKKALEITALSSPFLLLFMWGWWDVFATYLVVTFLILYLCIRSGYFLTPKTD